MHFEVVGRDVEELRSFFAALFGWEIDADNGLNYRMIGRDENLNAEGIGIGGGIGAAPRATRVTSRSMLQVPDVAAALGKAEQLGAKRLMGPTLIPGGDTVIGMFTDPEGHVIGVSNMP